MNQDILPSSALKQPDGPVQGPHMLLDEEGLSRVRHDIPKLGAFMTDQEVEAIHQLDQHRTAVREAGWSNSSDSTYTEEDHVNDLTSITSADANIRQQTLEKRNDVIVQDTLKRVGA